MVAHLSFFVLRLLGGGNQLWSSLRQLARIQFLLTISTWAPSSSRQQCGRSTSQALNLSKFHFCCIFLFPLPLSGLLYHYIGPTQIIQAHLLTLRSPVKSLLTCTVTFPQAWHQGANVMGSKLGWPHGMCGKLWVDSFNSQSSLFGVCFLVLFPL